MGQQRKFCRFLRITHKMLLAFVSSLFFISAHNSIFAANTIITPIDSFDSSCINRYCQITENLFCMMVEAGYIVPDVGAEAISLKELSQQDQTSSYANFFSQRHLICYSPESNETSEDISMSRNYLDQYSIGYISTRGQVVKLSTSTPTELIDRLNIMVSAGSIETEILEDLLNNFYDYTNNPDKFIYQNLTPVGQCNNNSIIPPEIEEEHTSADQCVFYNEEGFVQLKFYTSGSNGYDLNYENPIYNDLGATIYFNSDEYGYTPDSSEHIIGYIYNIDEYFSPSSSTEVYERFQTDFFGFKNLSEQYSNFILFTNYKPTHLDNSYNDVDDFINMYDDSSVVCLGDSSVCANISGNDKFVYFDETGTLRGILPDSSDIKYYFNPYLTETLGGAGNETDSGGGTTSTTSCSTGYHISGNNCATNTYTVSYNANGGTGSTTSSSHNYGTAKALTSNGFTKTGYIFSGWNTQPNGSGTSYTDNQSVTNLTYLNSVTITLYAQWTPIEFTITTTNMDANGKFSFQISAAGTFYIDWGDSTVETINQANTADNTYTTYSHTYTTSGVHTIGMAGQVTEYGNVYYDDNLELYITPTAIRFSGNKNIAGISGSLGDIFGTLSSGTNKQPNFSNTFSGCSSLTSISDDLFSGIQGTPAEEMFAYTFYGCTGLTSIPNGLFSDIQGAPLFAIFTGTFAGCTGLQSYIPDTTFSGMEQYYKDNNLTYDDTDDDNFDAIFYNTNLLTQCPANMYQHITGFEGDWNSKVSCSNCPAGTTSPAGSTSIDQCVLPTATITYYTNGGSGCDNDTYTPGTTKELCTPTYAGHIFKGWYTAATGGNRVTSITAVDTGDKTLYAQWTANTYRCDAGYYLAKNGTSCTVCPAGSYCSGGSYTYSTTTDQGKTTCPTGYTSSAAGATSINECYTSCTVANIAHASAISGNDYYGTGTDTCSATSCDNGWHVKAGLNLASIIGTDAAMYWAYIDNNNTFIEYDHYWNSQNQGQNHYGITDNMSFAMDYGTRGIVTGMAQCSETNGVFLETTGTPSNTHGKHCWCKITGYTPIDGAKQELSATWVFSDDGDFSSIAESQCDDYCPMYCVSLGYQYGYLFTSWLFSTASSAPSCEANTYTITFDGNEATSGSTESVTCTYGSDCALTMSDFTKTNYTFSGWNTEADRTEADLRGIWFTNGQNVNNLTATDGATVTLYAQWTANTYTCSAGYYLAKNGTSCTTCPVGSYCGGGSYSYSTTTDQGKTTCPTGYTSSASGATSINECYTSCTVAQVSHASAVKGNDYYGTGTDTCEPTECVSGWHVKAGLNLASTIGTDAGSYYARINNSGTFYEDGSKGQTYYGITSKNEFAVDYGTKGIVTGLGRCSTQEGTDNNWTWTDPTIKTTLADETGTGSYCYCQITGYTPVGGTKQSLSSSWVFNNDLTVDGADVCASDCASSCATSCALRYDVTSALAFRSAMLGSLGASAPSCEANTYTIEFNGNGSTSGSTESVTCTYGSDCAIIENGYEKTGYTFSGWNTQPNGSGTSYTDNQSVTNLTATNGATVTLYAQWTATTRNITYNTNGGSGCDNDTYTPGTTKELCTPTYEGYTFLGWYTAATGGNKITSITALDTGDKTFYAQWTANTYRCDAGYYLAKNGTSCTVCTAGSYCTGGTYTYSTTTDQGITSCPNGYQYSESGSSLITQCYTECSTSDTASSYATSVSGYSYYGSETNTCQITQCDVGYHLKNKIDLTSIIGNEIATSYASINNFTVFTENDSTYNNPNKGQIHYGITQNNEFAVDYGNKGMITGRATCTTLTGNNNNRKWTNPTKSETLSNEIGDTEAINCYCQITGYTPIGETKQNLYSAWVFNDTYTHAGLCSSHCAHYCALNLRLGGTDFLRFRKALLDSLDIQIHDCEANRYTLVYYSNTGEENINSTDCKYGTYCSISENTFIRDGYTFSGWNTKSDGTGTTYTEKQMVRNLATSNDDTITLYAQWTPNTYNITYDYTNGGSGCDNDTYILGNTKTLTCIPTQTGYTFTGWYDAPVEGNKITTITSLDFNNKVFYAQWLPNDYLIHYETNGGTTCTDEQYSYTSSHNFACNTAKDGYNFVGWYTDAALTNSIKQIPSGSIGYQIVYARWTPILYTITYNLHSYVNNIGNPSVYTIESPTLTLIDPTQEWFDFVGWYTDPQFTGSAITSIPQGSIGNKVFYAKWDIRYCPIGKYKNNNECSICPADKYCPGDNSAVDCPQGLLSPGGAKDIGECGKILHIDKDILYLTTTRQTLPALAVRLDGNVYFGKMQPVSQGKKKINKDASLSLKVKLSGTEYYIYDNTITGE